jgi:glycosyltransferase involved in cell wall biosynthesis
VLLPGFKQYPDLPAYYGLASAFIHASTTEQWGLVVNEAMASGLPVLVSNRCGCAQDLVREGVNGFTFDPYNVEEMANVMLRLTETPKHRLTEMGDASRQLISAWGPERFARGLHDAAETALKNPPPIATVYDRLLLMALIYK